MKLGKNTIEKLIKGAEKVSKQAYAPYSNFFVGATILSSLGNIYEGCNVENVSYGLTVCAERNAIFNAVSIEGSKMKIKAAVVSNASNSCSPCGACRQVIAEFSDNNTIIIYKNNGKYIEKKITEILPCNFKFNSD
jgi:cytidine deaminase